MESMLLRQLEASLLPKETLLCNKLIPRTNCSPLYTQYKHAPLLL